MEGFHSFKDADFRQRWPGPIDGYQQNVVKISRSGALSWNGVDLTDMHGDGGGKIETFLEELRGFDPKPFTVLDFDKDAPCGKVERVRALMIEHAGCTVADQCFQGAM